MKVDHDGVTLVGSDSGGDGTPVVFLHGLCGHRGEWDAVVAALPPGLRVITFDQRGNGDSTRRPGDMSRRAHALDVVAVLDASGIERAVLVGQSMGGDTAMVTAARHPERVRGLVLVEAGPHDPEPSGGRTIAQWLASWPRPFASRADAVGFFGGGPVGEGWADGLAERDSGWWPRFDADVIDAVVAADPDRDQWAEWALVACPTLAVFGQTGVISAERGLRMLDRRPATAAVSVPGTGHDVHLERPVTLAALINDFVGETDVPVGLVLLVGPPGAGKSTYAAGWIAAGQLDRAGIVSCDTVRAEMFGAEVRTSDDPAVFAEMDRRVVARLAEGLPVVVDATNVSVVARARMWQWARQNGRPMTAVRFVVEDEVLLRRNAGRSGHQRVPNADVLRYAEVMRTEASRRQLIQEGVDVVIDVPLRSAGSTR